MPTLNWIGKEAVVNHHNQVPFRTLDKKYTFGGDDSENKIIHGDNLEALKALLPEYEGQIKCIYIDPPYNTGASPENGGWKYYDNVDSPRIRKWLGQAVGKESEDLSRHDKWLCMMYPRLKLLQRLLSNDGAIFISIDDNEQANLKLICDEIFGIENFVAQLIWRGGKRNLAKWISTSHDYMLLYTKNLSYCSECGITWKEKKNGIDDIYKTADELIKQTSRDYKTATKLLKKWFKDLPDNHPSKDHDHYCNIDSKGVYCMDNVSRVGGGKYSVLSPKTGNIIAPPSRGWTYGNEDDFWEAYKNGIIEFTENDTLPIFKRYLKDNETQLLETVFYKDRRSSSQKLKELMGAEVFQFPKDEEVLRHFIEIFSNKNSIILDSFAGSGTTAHAVLNLNKQDGGNRKFILVEMEDYAENITAERVRRVINGYGEGKNAVEGTGGSFSYYELGEPIFNEDGYLNESVGTEKLREYVWYTETRVPYVGLSYNGSRQNEPKNGCHTVTALRYLLGNHNGTAYYFYYEPDQITTLSHETLAIIGEKAETYVVYADQCVIDREWLAANNIIFKKIPRDIRNF
ncbi:MAG: site-specific DNA-methyltransferase [Salinivirgaceae bacterium]|nr:site-specific DNA-methyltransferase [Salinivirgaceae bacterium]